jgi:catechol 2,3-dioxygenase-like lactoylglutathione lyase family enzyme
MRTLSGAVLTSILFAGTTTAKEPPKRPKITGIASVTILSSDVPSALAFEKKILYQETPCDFCERVPSRFLSLGGQSIELREAPTGTTNMLLEVSFRTEDLERLRKFLKANGVKLQKQKGAGSSPPIVMSDPEGHRISFIGPANGPTQHSPFVVRSDTDLFSSLRIIHAGFVVKDRAAEDKFYKDILGFHVYWHGGMKDGEDNWVDMQVPDGTDWIEYMLGVHENASHKTLGVMNHIALGVPDIHKAQEQLIQNGFKPTEEPKIGRDGKWQLNLYDPDDTRVELMEFAPTEKPCCAEYTGPHPK